MLECVINVSEGCDAALIQTIAAAAGPRLLDVHSDADHNRSVLTIGGDDRGVESAVQAVAEAAVADLDLTAHSGVHPRIGVLDVVPFVALSVTGRGAPMTGDGQPGWVADDGALDQAVGARDRFAAWAARELGLPCFLYGPERTLPEVRKGAWRTIPPDHGPDRPHPTAGAVAVGARPVLVAFNLWLAPDASPELAAEVARRVRSPAVRALGLQVGSGRRVQVSCNLIDPGRVGPGAVYDRVAQALREVAEGGTESGAVRTPDGPVIERAELVGLIPRRVLYDEPPSRWGRLGLRPDQTSEARLEQAGLDGGRF